MPFSYDTPAIPRHMRAVLLRGHGDIHMLSVRDDVPVPRPARGEVLVQVMAAGVNNTDIAVRTGWYSGSVQRGTEPAAALWTGSGMAFPRIQGADACGYIVATGEGVDPSRIGERVLVEPIFRYRLPDGGEQFDYFGSECDGAFAEYTLAPSVHAHRVRSMLTDAQLACFPCAWSAAENMIQRARVSAGDRVLVTAASGGVGSAALQLARRRGAEVIAVASYAKAPELAAMGFEHVIHRESDPLKVLGPDSLDVVIDSAGGPAMKSILQGLSRGGRYAVAGAIAGAEVGIDLRTVYLKDLSILGCTVFPAGLFADLVGYIERGELRPLLAAEYPLEDIAIAQEAFLRKAHIGKIVLSV
jgi:NADPH:quinone reductase-like Zn-dependent oxidoreductase